MKILGKLIEGMGTQKLSVALGPWRWDAEGTLAVLLLAALVLLVLI